MKYTKYYDYIKQRYYSCFKKINTWDLNIHGFLRDSNKKYKITFTNHNQLIDKKINALNRAINELVTFQYNDKNHLIFKAIEYLHYTKTQLAQQKTNTVIDYDNLKF